MDISQYEEKNYESATFMSALPNNSKSEPCMLGIDEAGRGPVLGPMVYAAAYCALSWTEKLKDLGCADSKTLTEEKREELFDLIDKNNENIGWLLDIHSPTTISNSMLSRCKYNLNSLSQDSAAGLIKKALDAGINVEEVYVDTVGMPDKYQAKLSNIFPDLKITVAKQADSTFPIVSAASICAKVARDRILKSWTFPEGNDFANKEYGSGYPNDPLTKKFLSENIDPVFGFPQMVRFSWSTAEKILKKSAIEVEWDDNEEAEASSNGTPSVSQYFQSAKKPKLEKKGKSHYFFVERNIKQVENV